MNNIKKLHETKRILIVEDEPLVAMDIESELRDRGWDIAGVAGTVAKAFMLVENAKPSIALLDINLSGSTSLDIAKKLKTRNIPVVFLSGASFACLSADFESSPVLTKPVNFDELDRILKMEICCKI